MKTGIVFCFLLVRVCTAIHTVSAHSSVEQHYRSDTEALKKYTLQRTLLQEDSTSERPPVSRGGQPLPGIGKIFEDKKVTVDRSCIISLDVVRPGNTYKDPASLILEDVFDCCFACEDDERCVSWTYDRGTGAFSMLDSERWRFVSSGGADIDDGFKYRYKFYANGTRGAVAARTVDSRAPVPLNECAKESGVAYPRGSILRVTTTSSHKACCELCRNAPDCFSWYRNASNRRCVLNRNAPSKVGRGGHYAGATVI